MIDVNFQFMQMYEPGEDAPPQFELEGVIVRKIPSVPMYSDRVVFSGREYFVYHVEYDIGDTPESNVSVRIVCTRKVFHPPKRI